MSGLDAPPSLYSSLPSDTKHTEVAAVTPSIPSVPKYNGSQQEKYDHTSSGNMDAEGDPAFLREDPLHGFSLFCHEVLNVEKSIVGSENDPTYAILLAAANKAPEQFWQSSLDSSNKDQFENLVKRCRNWISVLSRKKSFLKIIPALRVLQRLPLNDTLVKQLGISTIVTNLMESTSLDEVRDAAESLAAKYRDVFESENRLDGSSTSSASSSRPSSSTPKLFNDVGALKLRTHKRVRERSPPPMASSPSSENSSLMDAANSERPTTEDAEPARKRAKSTKRVHWKADADLVAVRYFEMDGIAKFKSAKNARQQEHDEGSAMHPHIEWVMPVTIEFSGCFGNEQLRSLMSTRRGGKKEPISEEARIQHQREVSGAPIPSDNTLVTPDSPGEPPACERNPDQSWKPRDGGKFTPATPPREWLQKHNMLNTGMNPQMPPMVPQMPPMVPQMMPSFPWAMNYPMNMNMNMNMGMSPAQMSEMMKMNTNMFGKQ